MRRFLYILDRQRRTTSDQSYELVKPKSFTTVPTSRTSYQRSQIKSRNQGKTHIFQHLTKHFEASCRNSRKLKRRKEPNYGQELAFQSKHRMTTKTSWNGHQAEWENVKFITF